MQFILDDPAAGDWNMAVDQALLEAAAAGQQLYLRCYQWRPATLSLGYFQRRADRAGHPSSRNCPLVRRPSGGGAILHDRELTYALAAPARHPLAQRAASLYRATHEELIAALAEFGVSAALFANAQRPSSAGEAARIAEPFLCFQRRSAADVLVGSHKIAGSAQRRRAGAVLQHGSILLAQSPAAPELPGVQEAAGKWIAPAELAERFSRRLAARLGADLAGYALPEDLADRVETLREDKYASETWTARR